MLNEATKLYEGAPTADAARWLLARGLTTETIATFRLGVVGNDPFPGHGNHRGRIVIPYLDKDGLPLKLRFRCIEQHDHRELFHGKYNSVTGDPSRVFNVRAIHQAEDEIHVCEGELDAMILNQIGLPAIAIPGAHTWAPYMRRMLAGFNRVWLWTDPDDAGSELMNTMMRAMRQAKPARLKGGDVNDTYLAGGADALLALVREGA